MPDAVVEDLHAELLDDEVDDVVLHDARDAGEDREGDGEGEESEDAGDELAVGATVGVERVAVDDLAEDDGVDEAEELRDAGERQRQENEPAVRAQVRPQNSHERNLASCRAAARPAVVLVRAAA